MTKELTVKEAALKKKLSTPRINAKIKQGHYPHARKCECGKTWFIPESDLKLIPPDRRRK